MASGPEQAPHQFRGYQDLDVWQLGMDIAAACHLLTRGFPREELFGMTSQIRRAAASIPFNIAEGWGRDQTGEFVRFLRIAQGSLKEVETQLLLAERIELASRDSVSPILAMTDREGRMIRSLIRSLGGN
ncbi:MAG: four helix bundle protein [Planctomycetes bacterium]|nr:four helix bundle protein [Planctomycetota bacterium]